ncbi:pentatricopeptide repeat-containing protein At5g15010, mitochondrial-like [Amborella trichopoda]|uniref:pentatricopeptide repeat-containing protein At5g15010, mitochondrial-like n=1 Tax=Amborella trichopoda TaxID=13333 RepID=UPI0009C16E49|nr:pentatricopeptide repeat-containing protein At5g15010, mitochondrial-like [Amborella trichopoda]|eukprot:XP_020518262.1 pentatricopeptide repeat-containing protein At5g15010, mitochondrial-like [Amborella trichopoda]
MPSIEQEFRVSESSFLCKCNFVSCPSMDAWYGFNGWVVCLGFPKSKHLLEIDEFSWLTAGRNSRVFKFPGFNRWKDEVIDALVNNINSQASTVRKIEEAINLLQAMYQDGVEPNIITYNSLLNGLCKDGKIEEAIKLFELMYQGSCIFIEQMVSLFAKSLSKGLHEYLLNKFLNFSGDQSCQVSTPSFIVGGWNCSLLIPPISCYGVRISMPLRYWLPTEQDGSQVEELSRFLWWKTSCQRWFS